MRERVCVREREIKDSVKKNNHSSITPAVLLINRAVKSSLNFSTNIIFADFSYLNGFKHLILSG